MTSFALVAVTLCAVAFPSICASAENGMDGKVNLAEIESETTSGLERKTRAPDYYYYDDDESYRSRGTCQSPPCDIGLCGDLYVPHCCRLAGYPYCSTYTNRCHCLKGVDLEVMYFGKCDGRMGPDC